MPDFKSMEIFRPGTHTDMGGNTIDFSDAVCKQIADDYSPELFQAPIVVGHPKLNDEAKGWVTKLNFSEKLVAVPEQVEPQFAEMVNAGRFKKVSASFYMPDSPNNPLNASGKKGFYLRHVGFLGAMAPAVKGLKPVTFSEDEKGIVTLEFSDYTEGMIASALRNLREWILSKWNMDEANKALPAEKLDAIAASCEMDKHMSMMPKPEAEASDMAEKKSIQEAEAMTEKEKLEFAEREKTLKEKETSFAEKEKALNEEKKALDRAKTTNFIEDQIKAGKVLPVHKEGLVSFMESLKPEAVSFGEVKTDSVSFFKRFLTELPTVVHFGETPKDEIPTNPDEMTPEQVAKKINEIMFSESEKGNKITAAQAGSMLKEMGAKK